MQRISAFTITIALSAALVGCSKSKGGQAPSQQPELRQDKPAWTLTLRSSCAAEAEENCVAKYGFAVKADGSYEIGPGPQGQLKTGKLSEQELRELATLVSVAPAAAESCSDLTENDAEPESSDSVILQRSDKELTLFRTETTRTCFQTATRESGERLHHAIHALAGKYYELPFPDACAEATDLVRGLYPSVQGCATDMDCAYITDDYDVIPTEAVEYVITDNCSKVRPLAVGNARAVKAQQTALIDALIHAQEVCSYRILRDDCSEMSGFLSSLGAPVCQQGVCRANPNANPLR
ncbi:MAG: hypothetical protein NDJ89_01065 [Oligoflexia bacterium]|nr:hypothetical protein [Oligoflexia bacterium]